MRRESLGEEESLEESQRVEIGKGVTVVHHQDEGRGLCGVEEVGADSAAEEVFEVGGEGGAEEAGGEEEEESGPDGPDGQTGELLDGGHSALGLGGLRAGRCCCYCCWIGDVLGRAEQDATDP